MKKANKPILFIDSGIGGLTVLYETIKKQPNCDYIYFADYENAPFGSRSATFLRKKLLENLHFLNQKYNPQGIVLACNTMTAVAVNVVRRIYTNKFIVGTEPAIIPAIRDNKKNILVIATENTIKYNKLIKSQKQNENINLYTLSLPNLSTLIEQNIDSLETLRSILKNYLLPYLQKIDALVLGCTHYIYLKPILKEILSTDIKIYDGNQGVSNQIIKKAYENKIGKLIVYTNKANCGINLVSAWNLLKTRGSELCVE